MLKTAKFFSVVAAALTLVSAVDDWEEVWIFFRCCFRAGSPFPLPLLSLLRLPRLHALCKCQFFSSNNTRFHSTALNFSGNSYAVHASAPDLDRLQDRHMISTDELYTFPCLCVCISLLTTPLSQRLACTLGQRCIVHSSSFLILHS